MRCPQCGCTDNHVVDTRSTGQGQAVRRRRECKECRSRFTTYEYIQERPLRVLKSRGDTEDFERAKLVRSIQVACAKRPVSPSTIDAIAGNIQYTLTVEGAARSGVRASARWLWKRSNRWIGLPTSASRPCTGTSRISKSSKR